MKKLASTPCRSCWRAAAPIALCAQLSLAGVAYAQDGAIDALPAANSPPIPADFRIEPVLRSEIECGAPSASGAGGTGAFDCPFAASSLGLNLAQKIDLPDGTIEMRIGAGRGRNASLSLDRQMFGTAPGMVYESSLVTLGSDASLFDGRIRLKSELGWSRTWQQHRAPSLLFDRRQGEETGFSQDHQLNLVAIDQQGFDLRFDGRLARVDQSFRTGSISRIGAISLGNGDIDQLSARLRAGKFKAHAQVHASQTIFSDSDLRKFKLGYAGVTLGYSQRDGRTTPYGPYAFAVSNSRSEKLSLEFNLYDLAPMLAMENTGLGSLIPRQLTITSERRDLVHPARSDRLASQRETLGLFGLWNTPLGDTMIDWQRYRKRDGAQMLIERGSQLFASHSASMGQWRLSADVMSLKTRGLNGENDDMLFYNASLRRSFANGVQLAARFGRDTQSFGGAASDFSLRDRSHSAKLELDLSKPLQKRLRNSSVYLTLEGQLRLNRSGYELRFLDEVIDSDRDSYARQGVLMSFGYSF